MKKMNFALLLAAGSHISASPTGYGSCASHQSPACTQLINGTPWARKAGAGSTLDSKKVFTQKQLVLEFVAEVTT